MSPLADILVKSAAYALAMCIPFVGAAWIVSAVWEGFHSPRPRWRR